MSSSHTPLVPGVQKAARSGHRQSVPAVGVTDTQMRSGKKSYSRKTFYMGHAGEKLLEGADNASGRLENICRRLEFLTRASRPEFSVAEWAVVVLGLREGVGLAEFEAHVPLLSWAHVYEDHAREAYGVDAVDVARRLADIGPAANVIACELTERYWSLSGDLDHAERLEVLQLAKPEDVQLWKADAVRRSEFIRKAGKPEGR